MPAAAIISAAAGAASSILNPILQHNENIRNRNFAREQYQTMRKDNLSDYDRENAYNSPQQQMARLKAAGLNPNMVYGNGAVASGGSVNSASAQSPQGQAPEFNPPDIQGMIGQSQANRNAKAQEDILAQQLLNMQAQKDLTEAQAEAVRASTPGKTYDSTMKGTLSELYPAITKENLRKLSIGNENAELGNLYRRDANFRAETRLENETALTLQRIAESKAKMANLPAQREAWLAAAKNARSSAAFTEVKEKGQWTQNQTLKYIQEGVLLNNLIKGGTLSKQEVETRLLEIKEKFRGMGLSETATSDMMNTIFGAMPKTSTVTHIKGK